MRGTTIKWEVRGWDAKIGSVAEPRAMVVPTPSWNLVGGNVCSQRVGRFPFFTPFL